MSIVTLKRKTAAKYHHSHISSKNGAIICGVVTQGTCLNNGGFSLNGTHRSQGYVGQDMLGRSLPKTIMKGNVIKGHGGCCGKFPIQRIVQSAVTSTNNPNVVKKSVKNTPGMLMNRYRWIRRPAPFSSVKPDSTSNINTQQQYIERLRQGALQFANSQSLNIASKTATTCTISKDIDIAAPRMHSVAMTQSKYLLNLEDRCVANDVFQFTHATRKAPFAGFV